MPRPVRSLPGRLAAAALLAAMALVAPSDARALTADEQVVVGQAFRAAGRGEWPRVGRLLDEVADPLPAKTLRWLYLMDDREQPGFAAIADFLMANPHWPQAEQLQIKAEGAIRDPADHALVRAFFAERAPLTSRGRIRYAEALLRIGADDEAIGLLREAWIDGDFSARDEARFLAQHGSHLRQQDHVARLDSLLWDLRRSSAQRMLKRVPADRRKIAEARIALQANRGGVDRAIQAVPAALRDDPGLAFDRLRWRRQHRQFDGVEAILLDPPAELGRPDRWWFERELEIRRTLRERDFARALRIAASHQQTEGADFAEASWLAGWLALRHGRRPDEALRRFVAMYETVSAPTERSRAAYWAGRSATALGDQATARYWYEAASTHPVAYYGQLAAAELGRPLTVVAPPPPDAAQRATFEAREMVQVARMLVDVGADAQLRPFALHLIAEAASPTEVGMAAELIGESGRVDLVTQGSRAAAWRGQVNLAAAFPIPDLAVLLDSPAPPEVPLLLGIARQESAFNTWGRSHAGAQGLLQLMPGTASLMARALRLPYNSARLTADPHYNIQLGRHYLRTMLDRYDGEVVLALSAYNAGPGRAEAWLDLNGDPRRGGRHDLVDWVELIPFTETRNYIQRVTEALNIYRLRLADAGATRVRFLEVAGPIRPVPAPSRKPRRAAGVTQEAPVVAGAPLPRLKPVVETSLTPSTAPSAAPIPAEPPEARRPDLVIRLAQASDEQAWPSGQAMAGPARMPQERPALAATDADAATPVLSGARPEPKPDRVAAVGGGAPPRPELKPDGS